MEEFDYWGECWLPEKPERRLGGRLSFSHERGLSLSLVGCLGHDPENDSEDEHAIVHGQAADAGSVTLRRCWHRGRSKSCSPGSPVLVIANYEARTAFLGAHFHSAEEMRFREAEVGYSHLIDWVEPRSFAWAHPPGEAGEHVDAVTYQRPAPITATVQSVEVSLASELTCEYGRFSARMDETYAVHLKAPEPWTVAEWIERIAASLQHLLTFATGVPNALTELVVRVPETGEAYRGSPHRWVRVVWWVTGARRTAEGATQRADQLTRWGMLFA